MESIMATQAPRRTFGQILHSWWQDWRRKRNALSELERCGSEAGHIARDLGVAPGELRVLAAKRPDSADLLYQRLASLHLDADKIAVAEGAVLRDLQRHCSLCGTKGKCARDLANGSPAADWQEYCPNAGTLEALTTETENERALARLERRQTRARRIQ
jgi:hypothetical protein